MNGRVAVIVCPTIVEQVAELPILVATNNTISIMPEVMPLAYAFTVPWDQALPAENIQVIKSGKRLRKCIWQKKSRQRIAQRLKRLVQLLALADGVPLERVLANASHSIAAYSQRMQQVRDCDAGGFGE